MSHANFVHLHVHSAYSLLEGAIKIPDLISLCEKEEMPAVAVTDTGNLFGALEFSLAARRKGIQPIIGCQITVARPTGIGVSRGQRAPGQRPELDDLVLLVSDRSGYQNLMKLASRSFLEAPGGERPQITFDDLAEHSEGLIALTGGPRGALGALLAEGQHDAAMGYLRRLMALFPGALYIELMRHGEVVEDMIDGPQINLAYKFDLPLVATNNCFFSDPDMFEAHDALLCIADGAHVGDRDRRRLTPQHGFRSAQEMLQVFADIPEAVENTLVIARRCTFMPDEHAPILPPFSTPHGISETDQLRAEAEEGLCLRTGVLDLDEEEIEPYRVRLKYELDVIVEMGFPGYFLIVSDFIKWAKAEGIPVGPGRGSGAGSVVAWALSITDLDPLEFGLLFERFLNPERVSMPDFDIDFCQDRRDEVIRYVQDKYGADRVAQIITFGKLQARAVLRDVGRVLAMPYGYVDKICKLVPFNPAHPPTLREALEAEPELRHLQNEDEQVARLLDIGMRLEGLFRHASTHAAGVVIGDRRLDELVPLYQDPRSNMAATQFSMKYTEAAGLVKFDFLGLKTLTVLSKAIAFLSQRGIDIDLLGLPLEDDVTYEMLSRGDTVGVFQLESSGMRDVLRQMRPDCFEDIIALVALYRPGPMDNIPRYIACKHGKEQPDYLHPDLEEILKETFGVMIYQEQVMQIAQVLSGFSLGSADLLRRAMGKKIKSEMKAQRNAFVDGAAARGVDKDQAGQIFDQVDKFAGYGFNKSHAAAYALVAYQTAWLKANYPVEFLAASMTLDIGNTDKLNIFKVELANLGIPLLPPDINDSDVVFGVRALGGVHESGAIRYALAAIKNVGAQAMASVVTERRENGPYEDVFDFAERIGTKAANKRQLENLIRAGALDSLHKNRRQIFEGVDIFLKIAHAAERDRADKQVSLFDRRGDILPKQQESLPDIRDWVPVERLKQEMEAVGLYLSAHPLDNYRKVLERLGVVPLDALTVASSGSKPRVAGVVDLIQQRTSAKGNRFAYLRLSCIGGQLEVVLFSEILSSSRELLESGKPLLLTCEARSDGEGVRLSAVLVEDLDLAVARSSAGLKVHVNREDAFMELKSAITQGKQGRGQVRLLLDINGHQSVELSLPGGYAVSADLRAAISAVPGVVELRDM
ncbi:DNA polymerase III subunit alpha [Alphaproteobacteria bacterium]|nr:DNA polymerase III subunit alpha [Alphaproteobacteria bacterium]